MLETGTLDQKRIQEATMRLSLTECEAPTQCEIIVPRGVILGYCFSHFV